VSRRPGRPRRRAPSRRATRRGRARLRTVLPAASCRTPSRRLRSTAQRRRPACRRVSKRTRACRYATPRRRTPRRCCRRAASTGRSEAVRRESGAGRRRSRRRRSPIRRVATPACLLRHSASSRGDAPRCRRHLRATRLRRAQTRRTCRRVNTRHRVRCRAAACVSPPASGRRSRCPCRGAFEHPSAQV
jgi:hypothetical protein